MNLRFSPRRIVTSLALALLFSGAPAVSAQTTANRNPAMIPVRPPAGAPVQVMVVGTFHFANPGRDLHNMQVDDVRTPAKQAELQEVADRLARFKPTKIAVEADSARPDLVYPKYEAFTLESLTQNANERDQIAFRLARQLGLPVVYGIDEETEFPFGKVQDYAKTHGQGALLDDLNARVESAMKTMGEAQKTTPIRTLLADMNEPAKTLSDHQAFYYGLLALGNELVQPGAELNGAWYVRNARIFAKLTQVAKPGDRILVVYGAGHKYWLEHFVRETPGFQLVQPNEYLR